MNSQRIFLYIDILGFRELVLNHSDKVPLIFSIINELKAHRHGDFKIIMFSDTIIFFNEDDSKPKDYYCTYLIEFTQDLFYKLLHHGIYFRAILCEGEFYYKKLSNIESYYGKALIDCYENEKEIQCMGLFIDNHLAEHVITFEQSTFNEKYNFIHLCQYLVRLYKESEGKLPVDEQLLTDTDDYYRIDEDLKFLRELEFMKEKHSCSRVREKCLNTYNQVKKRAPLFFAIFERDGFLPFIINEQYTGHFNPFEFIAEKEIIR